MEVSRDYKDLFKILNRYRVAYIVVGAYAVAYYTEPRFTKDLDIWVNPTASNGQRVYNALKGFGAPLKGMKPDDFTKKEMIYQIGVVPIRVDIMMDLAGIDFGAAWKNRRRSWYGGARINILGLNELKISKKRFGRKEDIFDLERLKTRKR